MGISSGIRIVISMVISIDISIIAYLLALLVSLININFYKFENGYVLNLRQKGILKSYWQKQHA
jgi:hypothetical protein